MKYLKPVLLLLAISISSTTNASVIKVLNGIEYEWLGLTATAGLSRDEVEFSLNDSNDVLYGYEYASRALVEDLYYSYSGWDGIGGSHSANDVVSGAVSFLNDFGHTVQQSNYNTFYSADEGVLIESSYVTLVHGIYGLDNECYYADKSCFTQWVVYSDENMTPLSSWQSVTHGWDSTFGAPSTMYDFVGSSQRGSFLVREFSAVPVPAGAWLFGSGLLGLIGVARRRKTA